MRKKLFINKNWFLIGDRQAAYIKSQFEKKAESYLYTYLDAIKIEGKTVNLNQIINYLERLFDNLNQKIKA